MGKKLMAGVAIAGAGGMMLGWGCLGGGDGWWKTVATDVALSAGYDFLLDNDAVFDLFQDDFGTGVLYDDRFAEDPTRNEPNADYDQNKRDGLTALYATF